MIEKQYTIVTAADERYREGLGLLMKSINRLWDEGCDSLEVVVLDNGLSRESVEKAEAFLTEGRVGFKMRVEKVEDLVPSDLPLKRADSSVAFYARLWISDFIDSCDVLYCDSDFLFGLNPKELIDYCREQNETVCAVRDYFDAVLSVDCPWEDQLSEEELNLPYFNSGLMYWDLKKPVFRGLHHEAIDLLNNAPRPSKYHDQSILNFIFRGQVGWLDERFNRVKFTNRDLVGWRSDYNIHFIGAVKPFHRQENHYPLSSANLIFRYLYDEELDFEEFWKAHFSFWLRCGLWVKFGFYYCFNRKRIKKLREKWVTKEELRGLYAYLVEFGEKGWR